MTLTSRYGDELSISPRQSSSFCRVACPRRPATRPSTVRTCPVMPSAYRRVIGARFGRMQMGSGGARASRAAITAAVPRGRPGPGTDRAFESLACAEPPTWLACPYGDATRGGARSREARAWPYAQAHCARVRPAGPARRSPAQGRTTECVHARRRVECRPPPISPRTSTASRHGRTAPGFATLGFARKNQPVDRKVRYGSEKLHGGGIRRAPTGRWQASGGAADAARSAADRPVRGARPARRRRHGAGLSGALGVRPAGGDQDGARPNSPRTSCSGSASRARSRRPARSAASTPPPSWTPTRGPPCPGWPPPTCPRPRSRRSSTSAGRCRPRPCAGWRPGSPRRCSPSTAPAWCTAT